MSFGDILGQIMQQGLGKAGPQHDRIETAARNLDQQGGLESILGQVQAALGRAGIDPATTSSLAGRARDFLQQDQAGGLSGAQIGGIGALAGAVLGRGLGGAARGSAMAVLGTLALSALRNAQAQSQTPAEPHSAEDITALASPENERLLVRAMISAAKADGQVDEAEMRAIIGRISSDSVTDAEKQAVLADLAAPLDVEALAADATTPAQAAQIYAASLLAINVDTDAERAYLATLANALKLDAATVTELHSSTGVPAA